MDRSAVLAEFDDQMRRNPAPGPRSLVEREQQVTRVIASDDGWSGVLWADLTEADADAAIEAQVLAARPRPVEAVVAVAGDTAISAGRVEFPEDSDFASLWGGGTLPDWRGRGVFRSLVAYRARLARERGYRYLQVDASADSSPILRRLGFAELARTTPFIYSGY